MKVVTHTGRLLACPAFSCIPTLVRFVQVGTGKLVQGRLLIARGVVKSKIHQFLTLPSSSKGTVASRVPWCPYIFFCFRWILPILTFPPLSRKFLWEASSILSPKPYPGRCRPRYALSERSLLCSPMAKVTVVGGRAIVMTAGKRNIDSETPGQRGYNLLALSTTISCLQPEGNSLKALLAT